MRCCIVDMGADPLVHQWALLSGLSVAREEQVIRVYRGGIELRLSNEQDEWLRDRGFERMFESCYLPSYAQGNVRAALVHALFEEIGAEEYRTGITSNKNVGCYDFLFQGVFRRISGVVKNVLDVGCGPGTILQSSIVADGQFCVGFDFVEAKVIEAKSAGLAVADVGELRALPIGSFDVFLSVFVLHYESIPKDTLEMLVKLLRKDGIWAANFHKSMGLTSFIEALSCCGEFAFEQEASQYGPILFARRVI